MPAPLPGPQRIPIGRGPDRRGGSPATGDGRNCALDVLGSCDDIRAPSTIEEPLVIPPPWFSLLKRFVHNRITVRGRQSGLAAFRDRISDLVLSTGMKDPVIVDGGANKGDVTALLLHHFAQPRIHAFEPISHLAERLTRRFHRYPSVIVHQFALGECAGQVDLHITNNVVSSSIFRPSAVNIGVHGAAVSINRSVPVRVVALDEHLAEQVDIIKLDLQGYELCALKGALRQLAGARAVLVEVEFLPMYDGQADFTGINDFLVGKGYRLHNLYDQWTLPDGQIEAADAIYLNERFYPATGRNI